MQWVHAMRGWFATAGLALDRGSVPVEHVEGSSDEARLRRAEMDIRWLRNFGMLGWFVVLQAQGYEFALTPVWVVYAIGVADTIWTHIQAERAVNIRRAAVVTTFGDPVLAASMCFVTGGIDSVLYPFFYFTQMSVAIRFGVIESLGVALWQSILTVFLFIAEPIYSGAPSPTMLSLGTTLFMLAFAGIEGGILAEWARGHAELLLKHARALREAGERYQGFLRRFAQVQEEERHNIAGELHDRMSGHMFLLRQGIEQCMREDLARDALQDKLHELSATVAACSRDVRSIMNELQPTVIQELGFYEAASEYLLRQAEIAPYRLTYHIDPTLRDWRSRHDAMLFRLLQEAMLNVQKHARARNVDVCLVSRTDDVELWIQDDGAGFDPQKIPIGHYGLMTMRERAAAAGGELSVESGGSRAGTRVTVKLPKANA
jgi:two-component system NarL family sensor kinase